jgi:hypothetical protein
MPKDTTLHMKIRLLLSTAAVAAVAVAVPASALNVSAVSLKAAAVKKQNPKASSTTGNTRTCDSADDGTNTITYSGPTAMWPPNHKMTPWTIVATDSSGDDAVTLFTVVTSDQPDNGVGDGNTDNDSVSDSSAADVATGTPSATNNGEVRSERSGTIKEGRTYTLTSTATFDNGETTCTETFTVTVAHDQGKRNG